jgi:hypothetical protein
MLMCLSCAEWTLTTAIAWTDIDTGLRIFCSQLSYIGALMAPVFLLFFTLEYTGRARRISPIQTTELLVLPIGATFAALTNDSHHLVWTSVVPDPAMPSVLVYNHGPLYWLASVYGLVIAAGASVVLVNFALRTRRIYRAQSAAVTIAALLPWISHVVYSVAGQYIPWFDPGMTIGLSTAVMTYGVMRYRLLDLVPVARDALVEQMPSGLMVIDAQDRVVEINPAAQALLHITESGVLGKSLGCVFADWPSLAGLLESRASDGVVAAPWGVHIALRTWPLAVSGDADGMAVLLSDVSIQVAAERLIGEAHTQLDSWVDELGDINRGLYGSSGATGADALS